MDGHGDQSNGNGETEPDIEFDQLCEACNELLDEDEDAAWSPDDYKPHHDVQALIDAAETGCHLCSLILAQISPSDVTCLLKELNNSGVAFPCQIGINIRGQETITLWAAVLKSAISRKEWDTCKNNWIAVAKLRIRQAEDDYTNPTRPKSSHNFSNSSIEQIQRWTETCQSRHVECRNVQTVTTTGNVLPTRLLDLTGATEDNQIKLCETQSLRPGIRYATLSHCWGVERHDPGRKYKLHEHELPAFKQGISLDCLPKTFRDAVLVTRKLGLYYLWIDALCIIQDSTADWLHEAARMGDVYANSFITLAATTSPDSEGGLLYKRSPLSTWSCRVTARWKSFPAGKMIISVPDWASKSDLQPLQSRSWVFQEWLLSKRLIHFGKDQIRWQCYGLAASEVYHEGDTDADGDLDNYGIPAKSTIVRLLGDQRKAADLWSQIREDYSHKALTRPGDRLPALTGIARMAHRALNTADNDYVAGLWRPHLIEELLWQRDGEIATTNSLDTSCLTPSWSWASISFPFLRFRQPGDAEEVRWQIRIIAVTVIPVADIFGPVTGGSLVLGCAMSRVTIITEKNSAGSGQQGHVCRVTAINDTTVDHDCRQTFDDPNHPASRATKHTFWFMAVRISFWPNAQRNSLTGLLLKETREYRGQYRRIGLLNIFSGKQHQVSMTTMSLTSSFRDDCYLDTISRADRMVEIV